MKRWMALLGALVLWYTGPDALRAQETDTGTAYKAQTSAGQVSLEARPEWRGGRLVVSLSANTHSVNLSTVDLAQSVRLVIGDQEFAPAEAGSLSGHHARATLVFQISAQPEAFQLRIRDVPDVEERVLEWPIGE